MDIGELCPSTLPEKLLRALSCFPGFCNATSLPFRRAQTNRIAIVVLALTAVASRRLPRIFGLRHQPALVIGSGMLSRCSCTLSAPGTPGFLRRRSDRSLIISRKNRKNNGTLEAGPGKSECGSQPSPAKRRARAALPADTSLTSLPALRITPDSVFSCRPSPTCRASGLKTQQCLAVT